MRNLLDRIFSNRRVSVVAPMIAAAVFYLLFVLFGQIDDKLNWMWLIPFISALWYGGVYFVFWIQMRNPLCPDGFLDFFELACFAAFGIASVFFAFRFFVNMAGGFAPTLCPAIITLSVVALVDKKRNE